MEGIKPGNRRFRIDMRRVLGYENAARVHRRSAELARCHAGSADRVLGVAGLMLESMRRHNGLRRNQYYGEYQIWNSSGFLAKRLHAQTVAIRLHYLKRYVRPHISL